MIHSTPKDKIIYSDVHDDLIVTEPWGEYKDSQFVGRLVFSDDLSTSCDVPIYEFAVRSLLDNFFDTYAVLDGIFRDETVVFNNSKYKDESLTMARGIVSDLKAMTARLEAAIVKSEKYAARNTDIGKE